MAERAQPRAEPAQPRAEPTQAGGLSSVTLCGRYRLEHLIGSGGMAQVWESTDLVLDRRVAVKVLHPHLANDESLVNRFRKEAVAAARLSHPGIVGIYDTCHDGSHEAIVMELLDASTLAEHLDRHGPLDADTTNRIALRLLEALEAAHRAGLVHRDIKPSNILLCRDGRVKVADFGIAKADDQTELTQEGTLVGTATYLAPEQLTGGTVDARTDLYSLGVVLYQCVTGRAPFTGDTSPAVALARLHSEPIDPRRYRADVPPQLAEAIMRSLRREPSERFASSAALRAALLETGAPTVVPPPTPTPLPDVEEDPTAETASFARTERGWLVPAIFILLIAAALSVAGLLLRETALSRSDDPAATTAAPADAVALELTDALPYDPQGRGDPGENDDRAARAIDGDPDTAWRTESYEARDFFGTKTGVGLGVEVATAGTDPTLSIESTPSGWSGEILRVPAARVRDGRPDTSDPDELDRVGSVSDVRGAVQVALVDVDLEPGDLLVVWITDLGEERDDGRHRVGLGELRLEAVPGTGG